MSTIANMKPAEAAGMPVPDSGRCPALRQAALFVQGRKVWVALVSLLVLIPCYWHARIAAGDLSSHVYNVWLAQLIRAGKAPGLYLEPRTNNILFDVMVDWSSRLLGFALAEKVCVSLAVLIFFWGAFAFVSAAARRAPWFLAPVLLMLTYGRTLSMGFMNFYLSLGFAFWGLAIAWRGKKFDFAAFLLLLPLAWMAHPLGFAFFVAVSGYVALTRVLAPKYQIVLVGASMMGALVIVRYLGNHYPGEHWQVPAYLVNGADQLRMFNDFYHQLSGALTVLLVAFVVVDFVRKKEKKDLLERLWVPVQLYLVIWFTLFLLPNTIIFPQYGAPVAFVVTRMTLALAVVACCALASIEDRVWHVAALAGIAAVFFFSLYLDTGRMNDYEAQAERLVTNLPPGQRVVASTIHMPPAAWPLWHVVDRACIGHCFVYSDYEPASQQFRVRGTDGNGIAVTNSEDVRLLQEGSYIVQQQDAPLFAISPCPNNRLKLCGRFVGAGEKTGLQ